METRKKKTSVIVNLSRKMGERSVNSACTWWYNQPKVPESMKKEKKDDC